MIPTNRAGNSRLRMRCNLSLTLMKGLGIMVVRIRMMGGIITGGMLLMVIGLVIEWQIPR